MSFFRRKPRHDHTWEVTGAEQRTTKVTLWDHNWQERTDRSTEVLARCTTCGATRTHGLTGHWTVEQLRGEMGAGE